MPSYLPESAPAATPLNGPSQAAPAEATVGELSDVDEVLVGLPWWAARGLLYLSLFLFVTALAWSALSRVDVVVTGRGTVTPRGRAQVVRAESGGPIAYILAKEGDTVRAGQVLVQLDREGIRKRLGASRIERNFRSKEAVQLRILDGTYAGSLEQQAEVARIDRERAALDEELRKTALTAPASGVVTRMEPRAIGTLLSAGETVAEIAPTDAPLVVEAFLANRDVAFLMPGQRVKIKLDAFPFYDYGTLPGRVTSISPDTAPVSPAPGAATTGANASPDGAAYRVIIALDRQDFFIADRQKPMPLRPGMSATAEIVTERRSILSYLLAPTRRLKGDAQSVGN